MVSRRDAGSSRAWVWWHTGRLLWDRRAHLGSSASFAGLPVEDQLAALSLTRGEQGLPALTLPSDER